MPLDEAGLSFRHPLEPYIDVRRSAPLQEVFRCRSGEISVKCIDTNGHAVYLDEGSLRAALMLIEALKIMTP